MFYLDVNIVFLTILGLDDAVTEETEEGLLITGDGLVQFGLVLGLEAAAEAVEEEAHSETSSSDDLLQYTEGRLVRGDHYTWQDDLSNSPLYQPLRDWSSRPPATLGIVSKPGRSLC